MSNGMRILRPLLDLHSDWLIQKWSIVIDRERISRDSMERSDWLI